MEKNICRIIVRIRLSWFQENVSDYSGFTRMLGEVLEKQYGEKYTLLRVTPTMLRVSLQTEKAEDDIREEIQLASAVLARLPELPSYAMVIRITKRTGEDDDWESAGSFAEESPQINLDQLNRGKREERRKVTERRLQEEAERRRREEARLEEEKKRDQEEEWQEKMRRQTLQEVEDLVGAEEFKAFCRELDQELPVLAENGSLSLFRKTCFLFSIDDGHGLTNAMEIFARFLYGRRVISEASADEEFVLPEPIPKEVENQLNKAWFELLRLAGKNSLFLLDISRWTGRTGTPVFRNFLLNIVRDWPMGILVIRIPVLSDKQFRTVYENLSDLFLVRSVLFPPFGRKEQHELAGKIFTRYGFQTDASLWPVFDEKMAAEAADGIVHGIHTYRKVVQEMILTAQKSPLFKSRRKPLTGEMVSRVLLSGPKAEEKDALAELETLVGLGEVKTLIPVIAKQIELSRNSGRLSGAALHMRFDGNPGTGKTTVARLLGRILASGGVLRRSRIVEKMGRDLVGIYVGETARITKSICEEAYGTILFIDEAYSLFRGRKDSGDFGREAMDVLITEMENHRDDLIVILAGYEEEMDHMFSGNPGLKSRVPYHIHFPNYTREELALIFKSMMESDGVGAEEGLYRAAEDFFGQIPDAAFKSPDFGNARLVRNIYQQAYGIAAVRLNVSRMEDIVISPEDFKKACDICRRQIPGMEKETGFSRIGLIPEE